MGEALVSALIFDKTSKSQVSFGGPSGGELRLISMRSFAFSAYKSWVDNLT